MFRPECVGYAQGGITSHGWDKKFGNNKLEANSVIVSLSTNDWEKANTLEKLLEIRKKITAKKVYWIEPNIESKPKAVEYVRAVANQYGDIVITTTRWQKDKIHPSWAGYKSIAEHTK
jgi:hypothetical protein